ncbi:hypothetical protein F511_32678 [Dorcoceras hygrometricum]|uniref:Uncharacterized protein n=1 Tax=Dorcoceras hygrometricum TaxID=472368 RepID=A0A2Z7DIW6_9LAMI|nr:hypothetical protein F511_32678 [Dorcoceras hygrometricum]
MSFVKANVIYDCYESITFYDQNSPKLNDNGKAGIGFQRPENSKPSWLKNKLDKDKAKAGSKSFVPNQSRRNSRKAKSGWTKAQSRRDLSGQNMKSKLNRSHGNYAQTLTDTYTGKTVKDNRYEPADVSNLIEVSADFESCIVSIRNENYRFLVKSTMVKVTVAPAGGIGISRYDIARSVRLSEEVTRVSQHVGVLTIDSADGLWNQLRVLSLDMMT